MRRRTYLATAAAVSTLSLAGCTGSSSLDDEAENGDGPNGDDPNGTTPGTDPTRDRPDAAGTVDDFEDLGAWTVVGGSLTADTERAVVGTQSARLDVPANEQMSRIATTFAEPRDFTDVVPGVAIATDGLLRPWLRLVDEGGETIEYRRGIAGGLPLERYDFGVTAVDPGFDAAAVREVHLQAWTAQGETRTVWVDDLHATPRPETGQVMIQFDDAHVTDYTTALPILEEHGYPAVTFVNAEYVDTGDSRLTTDQLHELHDAGWCIANHTDDHPHLSELDRTGQEAAIREGREWLVEQGFEDGADYFAYPFGDYDATTIDLVDDYHSMGFAGGPPAQGSLTNTKLVPRIGEPDADEVRTALERTVEMRGITSIFYHRLEGDDLESFETMVETIREYESRGDLEVILPADLEERFLF